MFQVREHVPGVTAVLSLVSLALVFGAVSGSVPAGAIPRTSDAALSVIPHVNAAISTVAIATIALGVRAIRRGNVSRHRALMLASLALFAAFLVLYLYKVAVAGTTPFAGPDVLYRFVYLPTLAVHVLLAVVCIPLLYYVLLLALTRSPAELAGTPHRRVGRVAAALWLVSFVLGNVVYVLLYVAF